MFVICNPLFSYYCFLKKQNIIYLHLNSVILKINWDFVMKSTPHSK